MSMKCQCGFEYPSPITSAHVCPSPARLKAGFSWTELIAESHAISIEHGWWEDEDLKDNHVIPTKLALIHSEISEALEEYRSGRLECRKSEGKPEGFAIELADAVIRIADLCGRLGIDLDEAIRIKTEYNRSRPFRHGGKKV